MKSLRAHFLLVTILASCFGIGASPSKWKTFRTTKYGFSVRYPADWHLLEGFDGSPDSKDALDIINFPNSQRVKGVVLKDGGASITVAPAPSQVQTIEQWIKEGTKYDTQIKQQAVRGFKTVSSGCKELIEVTSLSEVGPGRNFARTDFYCATEHKLLGVSLTNWEGDSKQRDLQELALKMALSLRTP